MTHNKSIKKCPHGHTFFCSSCSKAILVLYYNNQRNSETGKIKPTYRYSRLKQNPKGIDASVKSLRMFAEKNKHFLDSAIIYQNNPRKLIESINYKNQKQYV